MSTVLLIEMGIAQYSMRDLSAISILKFKINQHIMYTHLGNNLINLMDNERDVNPKWDGFLKSRLNS